MAIVKRDLSKSGLIVKGQGSSKKDKQRIALADGKEREVSWSRRSSSQPLASLITYVLVTLTDRLGR
jgi:hypothetical protein